MGVCIYVCQCLFCVIVCVCVCVCVCVWMSVTITGGCLFRLPVIDMTGGVRFVHVSH